MILPMERSGIGSAVTGNVATRWDVREVMGEVSGLREGFGQLRIEVVSVRADVDEVRVEVAALRRDVDKIRTEVAALRADVDEIRTEVVALRADVDGLKVDVARLDKRIEELRAETQLDFSMVKVEIEKLRGSVYKLLLGHAVVVVGLILALQRFFL